MVNVTHTTSSERDQIVKTTYYMILFIYNAKECKIHLQFRSHDSEDVWWYAVTGTDHDEDFSNKGNNLFLDLCANYTAVFILLKSIKMYRHDLWTFLYSTF